MILALIGVLIIAGNLVIDRPGKDSGRSGSDIALAAVSSETPIGVVFQFGSMIEDARADAAERVANRQQEALEEEREKVLRTSRQKEKFGDLPGAVTRQTLEAIADCESGGDPRIVSSNGLYHGKYQFHPDTWESVGGKGLPSEAPEAEQDHRAALLYERSGPGQWPVCGQ